VARSKVVYRQAKLDIMAWCRVIDGAIHYQIKGTRHSSVACEAAYTLL
jgi:hypothetical protein